VTSAITANGHIVIDDQGRACIAGTSFRVDQIAMEHVAYGWTAEEIFVQHYRRLTPAQIHSALAYYYDHESEINAVIQREDEAVDRLRSQAPASAFAERMRREGRLR
jgi:uncharacterized protein (DUF433 family)